MYGESLNYLYGCMVGFKPTLCQQFVPCTIEVFVRIARLSDLERLKGSDSSGMSDWASRQIKAALAESSSKSPDKPARDEAGSGLPRVQGRAVKSGKGVSANTVKGESAGEARVRMALCAAFGDWFRNKGEVIQELMPFQTRRFRADFALVRHRISVEVMGWHAHGQHLAEHHRDRERANWFARHDWLVFEVSHGQALGDLSDLIDGISEAMALRTPVPREAIKLIEVPHKNGIWYRLAPPA